jgi:hypothetical protein
MAKRILVLATLVVLAGCGKANEQAANEKFNKSFMESCVASASKGGAPLATVNKFCDCAIKKIDAKYGTYEKLVLPEDKLSPIMNECLESVVPK